MNIYHTDEELQRMALSPPRPANQTYSMDLGYIKMVESQTRPVFGVDIVNQVQVVIVEEEEESSVSGLVAAAIVILLIAMCCVC